MKDEAKMKGRKRVISMFVRVLILAAVFLGVAGYFIATKDSMSVAETEKVVTYVKILVFAGLFFVFCDCFFVLPRLFRKDRFADEKVMRQALEKYIPEGEMLEAGIYVTVKESLVNVIFKKCRYEKGMLVRDEFCELFGMEKRKYSEYAAYLGLTKSQLIVAECEQNKHFYGQLSAFPKDLANVPELNADISEKEIGIKFDLADIAKCEIKKGKQGARLCTVTMKNGSYFKINVPDNAGPTSEMPHHTAYCEKFFEMMKARS